MKEKIQVIPSGIPLVDLTWGGFYRGGTYFLFGPKKSGRTILALQFAKHAVKEKETCLYFTSVRPKDLMINAAAIDFDLQNCMNQNSVVVVRVTPPKNVELTKDPDTYLSEYIRDIDKVVNQYNPSRIVFDELTPFIGFKNLDLLSDVFLETIEPIEDKGIISLQILGEPATPAAQQVMDSLLNLSTGFISLQKKGNFANKEEPGLMKIYPNVGHTEGRFSADYFIEPYTGIQIDYHPFNSKGFTQSVYNKREYVKLSDIRVDEKSHSPINVYPVDDFKLILNNQIAFYKSTNEPFTLVSIKLHEGAEQNNLLTINQLQNAIRLSVDKKDKICTVRNKVLVLFTKEEKEISNFIGQIITNLPNNTPHYINKITRFISLYSVKVANETKNADEMFEQLFAANVYGKDNPNIF
jgi:circadian clock protein KaiC